MDRIGLLELIRIGVDAARTRIREHRTNDSIDVVWEDPQFGLILDRLTQIGILLLEHGVGELWDTLVNGVLQVYRAVLPTRAGYEEVSRAEGNILVMIIQRVFVLGAYAVHRQRFELLPTLVLQKPDREDGYYYWSRHAVTFAARAEVEGAFRGNSLIGPASEMVRTKSEFFALFDENMDVVVDAMCQFDAMQCILLVKQTGDLDACYPNFGGYWNHRTLPIIRDIAKGGRARHALGEMSDADLVTVLTELDRLASRAFFGVNGWRSNAWQYPEIEAFLKKNKPA